MVKNEYVVCPLCGMNKIVTAKKRLEKGKPERLTWPTIDLKEAFMLQVREGGGKKAGTGAKGKGKAPGSGFHLVPSESLTLAEIMKDPSYSDILEEMKDQLLRLIKDCIKIGFIAKEDIRR